MIETGIKDGVMSVFITLKLKKCGGCKMLLAPEGVQLQIII